MRLGTWNLAGRWSDAHASLLRDQRCDVWLLTEVPTGRALPGVAMVSSALMRPTKTWASVVGAGLDPVTSPIATASLAERAGTLMYSVVLPWRGASRGWPLEMRSGDSIAAWTRAALGALQPVLAEWPGPVVVGGDLNHSLVGPERAGTAVGRSAIVAFMDELGLQVPTAGCPHRIAGLGSIDHLAVPMGGPCAKSVGSRASWAVGA